jgi:hypothetical protein
MPLPPMMRPKRTHDIRLLKPWMKDYHFELVTPENIERVVDECIAVEAYGFDLETTSLDTRIFPRDTETGVHREVNLDIVGSDRMVFPRRTTFPSLSGIRRSVGCWTRPPSLLSTTASSRGRL